MYQSRFVCSDCGSQLMISWKWPEIVMNLPVRLVFICKQCKDEIKEIPESSTIIYSNGQSILDRHIDIYNQAVPYMSPGHFCIHRSEINRNNEPAIIAYKEGLTAG